MKEEFWNTKDGRRIAVADLEVDHMRHIIRGFIRKQREEADNDDLMPSDYGPHFWSYL